MEENITVVFRGFLNLSAKEKLALVEHINEYFDSNEREPVRAAAEARFAEIDWMEPSKKCKCCDR